MGKLYDAALACGGDLTFIGGENFLFWQSRHDIYSISVSAGQRDGNKKQLSTQHVDPHYFRLRRLRGRFVGDSSVEEV